jgi:glycosyltransferase involved in cell wall biosynthesis
MNAATDLLEPIAKRPGEGTPELSVLMPLYNSAKIVGDAVTSVLRQEGCIAEILISDDQSTDGTLAAASEALARWRGPHRVRLFRSRRRLIIDHIGALVAIATGDLLVQAHGDDISRRGRLARLLAIRRESGASLITSLASKPMGERVENEPLPENWTEGLLPLTRVIVSNPNAVLAGARYAVDRQVYDLFPRLDSDYLPIGHDSLLTIRASLLGGVWLCGQHLILRPERRHQWSKRLWDNRTWETGRFGYCLHRMGVLRAAYRDLAHVGKQKTVPVEKIKAAGEVLTKASTIIVNELLDSRDKLQRQGMAPMWVTEDVIEKGNLEDSKPWVVPDAARTPEKVES